VDVYPDGTAYNLADSCLRLRYRNGFEQPANLVPGQIHRVRIGGITTANYFPAGHQIRIEIAGSNFPLADRNSHAGHRNDLATDTSGPRTARSRPPPSPTDRLTSRRCTCAPTPARPRPTRLCPRRSPDLHPATARADDHLGGPGGACVTLPGSGGWPGLGGA